MGQSEVNEKIKALGIGQFVDFSNKLSPFAPQDWGDGSFAYVWLCRDLPTRVMRLAKGCKPPKRIV